MGLFVLWEKLWTLSPWRPTLIFISDDWRYDFGDSGEQSGFPDHVAWLKNAELGGVYRNILSHGVSGRFQKQDEVYVRKQLKQNNQIAFQYVDAAGVARSDSEYNPNGSVWAIEGITSPDGRILGKMGRTASVSARIYKIFKPSSI